MSRPCSICAVDALGAINAAIDEGRSLRSVAAEFEVSKDALGRHHRHLNRLAWAPSPNGNGNLDPLDELVTMLRSRSQSGDPAVIREYRLALTAQTAAAHAAVPQISFTDTTEWVELRSRILAALEEHPEARQAVAEALVGR